MELSHFQFTSAIWCPQIQTRAREIEWKVVSILRWLPKTNGVTDFQMSGCKLPLSWIISAYHEHSPQGPLRQANAVFRVAPPSITLHSLTRADMHCGRLGPSSPVHGDTSCEFPWRTMPDSVWVTQGEPMQSSGWPNPPLPRWWAKAKNVSEQDSSFNDLVAAIRSECMTVRGSTEASQCSLWGDPPPPPLLCSGDCHVTSTYPKMIKAICTNIWGKRVTCCEPIQCSEWPKPSKAAGDTRGEPM